MIKPSTFFCSSYSVNPSPSSQPLPCRACPAPWRPHSCSRLGCSLMLPDGFCRSRGSKYSCCPTPFPLKESNGVLMSLTTRIRVTAPQNCAVSLQCLQPDRPLRLFVICFIVMKHNVKITVNIQFSSFQSIPVVVPQTSRTFHLETGKFLPTHHNFSSLPPALGNYFSTLRFYGFDYFRYFI